jgi:ABC-type nickel/cobalt efflux system permease component RcnA
MDRDDPAPATEVRLDEMRPKRRFAWSSTSVNVIVGLAAGPALIAVLALAGQLAWHGIVGGVLLALLMGGLALSELTLAARTKRWMERQARDDR